VASIDQTEKRLRGIHAAGVALAERQVCEGIAVRRQQNGDWLGFRIDDVFGLWGGPDRVARACTSCPANAAPSAGGKPPIAGCFGWLAADGNIAAWHQAVEDGWPASPDLTSAIAGNIPTQPRWYSLWINRAIAGKQLELVARLFRAIGREGLPAIRGAAQHFVAVLETCHRNGLTLDVELVPAGFSDGLVWTIGRHCDRCRAPKRSGSIACSVCRKRGGGHPEVKKRVLGLRPWVPLSRVVGQTGEATFLARNGLTAEDT
jgi:hypothetical protein